MRVHTNIPCYLYTTTILSNHVFYFSFSAFPLTFPTSLLLLIADRPCLSSTECEPGEQSVRALHVLRDPHRCSGPRWTGLLISGPEALGAPRSAVP